MSKETKTFEITNVRFKGDDGKFFIYAVKDKDTNDRVTLKGNMPEFSVGMVVECHAVETEHPKFGKQYEPTSFVERSPETVQEKRALMNLFLTPNQVQSFIEVYGEPFDIIKEVEADTLKWQDVKNFGQKNFDALTKKIKNRRGGALISAKLSHFGVTAGMGEQLYKEYKTVEKALEAVENNPYILTNFKGLGFKTIDPIALDMGIELESIFRICAAARFITKQNELTGSTYMSLKGFVDEMFELLNISISLIQEADYGSDIFTDYDKGIVAFQDTYKREMYTFQFINKVTEDELIPFPLDEDKINQFIDRFEKANGVTFTDEQKSFFFAVRDYKVVCLLGYAGTGKSMLQKALVEMMNEAQWSVSLTAPTGRASKLLQDYTGKEALTIHSKLGIGVKKDRNDYGEEFDLDSRRFTDSDKPPYTVIEDVFVADEFSMTDTEVMYHISLNGSQAKRFIFIGDPEQLPSVGAGKVLLDLTQNGVKTIELTQVFRQSEGGILDLATRARQKKRLVEEKNGKQRMGEDTIFHQVLKDNIPNAVIHYIKILLKRMELSEITVVSPTNKGDIGVQSLNTLIQGEFNPSSPKKNEVEYGGTTYRPEDPILITESTPGILKREDYETILLLRKPVYKMTEAEKELAKKLPDFETFEERAPRYKLFNGELGKVVDIDTENQTLFIEVNGIQYAWERKVQKFSTLGYAMTIHKMQGSSNRAIIFVADKSNTYMLNRQLVYTGITRARERLVLIGTGYTLNGSVKRDGAVNRKTLLGELLKEHNEIKK